MGPSSSSLPTSRYRPARLIEIPEKLACVTIDFETDYGDRVGDFKILERHPDRLRELSGLFAELRVPVSAFIRTDMLERWPGSLQTLRDIAVDHHCHSHTHDTRSFDSVREIAATRAAFEEHFGAAPLGYRAPQGVLHEGDLDLLKEHGFAFSSSVFPSYRPGKFNHLKMPMVPFVYENGLVELPMAAVPTLRYTISLSYLKLLGRRLNQWFYRRWGLPNVLVFDSHLHDFIVCEESFEKLPPLLRLAWSVNKNAGVRYFTWFVEYLRARGYRFITMTDLFHHASSVGRRTSEV